MLHAAILGAALLVTVSPPPQLSISGESFVLVQSEMLRSAVAKGVAIISVDCVPLFECRPEYRHDGTYHTAIHRVSNVEGTYKIGSDSLCVTSSAGSYCVALYQSPGGQFATLGLGSRGWAAPTRVRLEALPSR